MILDDVRIKSPIKASTEFNTTENDLCIRSVSVMCKIRHYHCGIHGDDAEEDDDDKEEEEENKEKKNQQA